jgi:hypothetical protein
MTGAAVSPGVQVALRVARGRGAVEVVDDVDLVQQCGRVEPVGDIVVVRVAGLHLCSRLRLS